MTPTDTTALVKPDPQTVLRNSRSRTDCALLSAACLAAPALIISALLFESVSHSFLWKMMEELGCKMLPNQSHGGGLRPPFFAENRYLIVCKDRYDIRDDRQFECPNTTIDFCHIAEEKASKLYVEFVFEVLGGIGLYLIAIGIAALMVAKYRMWQDNKLNQDIETPGGPSL